MDEVPAVPRTGGNDARFDDAAERGLNTGVSAVVRRDLQLLNNGENIQQFGQRNVPRSFLYSNTPSFVKTFERVPGATIEGTLPENATTVSQVTVSVGLSPENGNNFTYTQQVDIENGEFTATVPYATTGYDEYGVEEGYTNTSVRALDSYSIRTGFAGFDNEAQGFVFYNGTVDIEEGKVIGEDPEPATVELERSVQEINLGGSAGSEDG
jgi:asparagine N-glycosylation enzyme membrane subunit Stt3